MQESKNIYALPILKKDLELVLSDPKTHVGADAYALDFVVPEGSVIKAAADGKIIYIKTDSNQGGDDLKYEDFKFYNHIIIKHANGEYTEYGHLKFQSTENKIGDMVKAGDTIAYSGNTGYSEKPHIHFSVFVLKGMRLDFEELPENKEYFINDDDFGFTTIRPKFKEEDLQFLKTKSV